MPPVFGPSSPSPIRLKSCAAGERHDLARRRTSAKSETSSPSSSSSITNGCPSAAAARSPASSSSCVRQTKTPLPAASPSALTTHGGRATGSVARGRHAGRLHDAPSRTSSSPRSARPRRPARRRRCRAWRSSSATPATSGASGPTTTRSIAERPRRGRATPRRRRRARDGSCPSAAIPGLPGAACSSLERGLCARALHASACSRPPDPTTSTFTAARVPTGRSALRTGVGLTCGSGQAPPYATAAVDVVRMPGGAVEPRPRRRRGAARDPHRRRARSP